MHIALIIMTVLAKRRERPANNLRSYCFLYWYEQALFIYLSTFRVTLFCDVFFNIVVAREFVGDAD